MSHRMHVQQETTYKKVPKLKLRDHKSVLTVQTNVPDPELFGKNLGDFYPWIRSKSTAFDSNTASNHILELQIVHEKSFKMRNYDFCILSSTIWIS
jgi:hypothetical protein